MIQPQTHSTYEEVLLVEADQISEVVEGMTTLGIPGCVYPYERWSEEYVAIETGVVVVVLDYAVYRGAGIWPNETGSARRDVGYGGMGLSSTVPADLGVGWWNAALNSDGFLLGATLYDALGCRVVHVAGTDEPFEAVYSFADDDYWVDGVADMGHFKRVRGWRGGELVEQDEWSLADVVSRYIGTGHWGPTNITEFTAIDPDECIRVEGSDIEWAPRVCVLCGSEDQANPRIPASVQLVCKACFGARPTLKPKPEPDPEPPPQLTGVFAFAVVALIALIVLIIVLL